MMILIGELVMGFVFGVGATMLIMFACDRYDDYRQKKEDEEKSADADDAVFMLSRALHIVAKK